MILLAALAALVVTPLIFGQSENCPEQAFQDISQCPAVLDANQIAIDPVMGQRCCLGWILTVVGSPWTWDGRYCDPDGDAMTLIASMGTLATNADGTYTVTGTSSTTGLTYITMTLSDQPATPQTPLTRKGTFAVIAVPKNKPPVLCGGQP
jgi:hypothetical protein